MINFDSSQAIYLQIAEFMSEKVLADEWPVNERIPSVREVAAMVQVNPNTVMRSFAHLQDQGVIFNKRGVGYFVAETGKEQVQAMKKESFVEKLLPQVFHEANLLAVTPDELKVLYENYQAQQNTAL